MREAEGEWQPPTDIGTNCVKNVWRCRWRQLRALSVEGKRRRILGPFTARARGERGAVGPPLKRLFGIPHIFMFLRSLPICPPHPSLTCPAPSAETLTPNEKRQQIIHHFAFRLASISSGKSCATQLGYCSRRRWPSAPTHSYPAPPLFARAQAPLALGEKILFGTVYHQFYVRFFFYFLFYSFFSLRLFSLLVCALLLVCYAPDDPVFFDTPSSFSYLTRTWLQREFPCSLLILACSENECRFQVFKGAT